VSIHNLDPAYYSFDVNGTIVDADFFWKPEERYDIPVPLHHFTIDIGYEALELRDLVDRALREMPPSYSETGELRAMKSEVFDRAGRLYVSTKYRPHIMPTIGKPSIGDVLDYRDVKVCGRLYYESGVIFARCDQIEFFEQRQPRLTGPVLPGAADF